MPQNHDCLCSEYYFLQKAMDAIGGKSGEKPGKTAASEALFCRVICKAAILTKWWFSKYTSRFLSCSYGY